MVLQLLFALLPQLPASTATHPPTLTPLHRVAEARKAVKTTNGSGRYLAAEVLSPAITSSDSRYPGALLISTDETRDRAFNVANKLTELGVTVMMYTQETNATHALLLLKAQQGVDSMRRRIDVRPEEVGVIAFEEAATVIPDLARDTLLTFAIVLSAYDPVRNPGARYVDARAAMLIVQGVDTAKPVGDSASNAARRDSAGKGLPSLIPPSSDSIARAKLPLPPPTLPPVRDSIQVIIDPNQMLDSIATTKPIPPNVTVWKVPREDIEELGDLHSALGGRLLAWLREQVHANPTPHPAAPITIH